MSFFSKIDSGLSWSKAPLKRSMYQIIDEGPQTFPNYCREELIGAVMETDLLLTQFRLQSVSFFEDHFNKPVFSSNSFIGFESILKH